MLNIIRFTLIVMALSATQAFAYSHAYYMQNRSSIENHVFVSQSVEGMYGKFSLASPADNLSAINAGGETQSQQQFWQGYTIRTSVGIEVLKFIQFSLSHGFVTLRSKDHSFENLRGSQLAGEAKLIFSSPLGNLEAGGGVVGSRYDYQRKLEDASFYGSGLYYTLGWNYFMTSQVSVSGNAKITNEHLNRNGGSTSIDNMDTDLTSLGLGFTIWL